MSEAETVGAGRPTATAVGVDPLGEAWAEAEAALPEYWFIRSLILIKPYTDPTWEAVAADQRQHIRADGPTPTAALRSLALRLRALHPEEARR